MFGFTFSYFSLSKSIVVVGVQKTGLSVHMCLCVSVCLSLCLFTLERKHYWGDLDDISINGKLYNLLYAF